LVKCALSVVLGVKCRIISFSYHPAFGRLRQGLRCREM
jgi:hypothetical protein